MAGVDKMSEESLPDPTRSDEQLVPVKARLPYGKSNLLLDLQKMQKNPIFRISEANIGAYRFQLDEQWFTLNSDLLCDALEITPVDPANPFVSPPAGEIVMDFCLTGKTSGNDKPRHLVLQMLWGIVTGTNVNYAELLWEEFVQRIQTFFTHWDGNKIPSKKPTLYVIPYCQFTKLIIYYLGSKYNIHKRPESPRHVTADDFLLGNLKFVPNGEKDEVFGMPVPQELSQKLFKRLNTTSITWKWLLAKSKKTSKPPPIKKSRKGKVQKVRKEKRPLKLIDEDEEGHGQAPVGGVAFREHGASGITQKLLVVEGKGKGIAIDEQSAQSLLELQTLKKKSTTDQYIF
ncbi:hypothetical protein Tco_0838981 [Tanacetum coccineum]|uniref:Transposase n=1 Tax=Tanacetum coccineum TaxID=301880 RepID=A0ABQ5AR57_9ASTR